jgi:hypothetical protein
MTYKEIAKQIFEEYIQENPVNFSDFEHPADVYDYFDRIFESDSFEDKYLHTDKETAKSNVMDDPDAVRQEFCEMDPDAMDVLDYMLEENWEFLDYIAKRAALTDVYFDYIHEHDEEIEKAIADSHFVYNI